MHRWPALMRLEEAASYLSLSPSTLKRLRSSGEVRTVLVRGTMPMFRRDDLDAWIDNLPYGTGVKVDDQQGRTAEAAR